MKHYHKISIYLWKYLLYNYYKNDYKTNKFVDCFIEIKNEDTKKVKQLYEG